MLEEIKKHNEQIRQNILKGFNSDLGDSIEENSLFNKGEIEYDELQKAVYADTAENRKLGRVGQEYHRGKGKQQEEQPKGRKKGSETVKKSASELRKIIHSLPNPTSKSEVETLKKILPEHKDYLADLAAKAEQMAESSWSEGKSRQYHGIADVIKDYIKNQQPDSKSIKSMITSILISDQGGISDDAETKKAISKIASEAEKFFKNNPELDKEKVLEHAIFDSDDENSFMDKYGKLKGASSLSSALNELF